MAHLVIIEDEHGELLDVEHYCSDYCARTSEHYAGWYGAQEIDYCRGCAHCGEHISGYLHDEVCYWGDGE